MLRLCHRCRNPAACHRASSVPYHVASTTVRTASLVIIEMRMAVIVVALLLHFLCSLSLGCPALNYCCMPRRQVTHNWHQHMHVHTHRCIRSSMTYKKEVKRLITDHTHAHTHTHTHTYNRGIRSTMTYKKAPGTTWQRFQRVMKKKREIHGGQFSYFGYVKAVYDAFSIAHVRGRWEVCSRVWVKRQYIFITHRKPCTITDDISHMYVSLNIGARCVALSANGITSHMSVEDARSAHCGCQHCLGDKVSVFCTWNSLSGKWWDMTIYACIYTYTYTLMWMVIEYASACMCITDDMRIHVYTYTRTKILTYEWRIVYTGCLHVYYKGYAYTHIQIYIQAQRNAYIWIEMCTQVAFMYISNDMHKPFPVRFLFALRYIIYIYIYIYIYICTHIVQIRVIKCFCMWIAANVYKGSGCAVLAGPLPRFLPPLWHAIWQVPRTFLVSSILYICMFIHVYVYTYVCLYMCVCSYISNGYLKDSTGLSGKQYFIHVYAYTCVCVYICMFIHVYVYFILVCCVCMWLCSK